MSDDGRIVGLITPAPALGDPPLFTIIKRDKPWDPPPGCEHGSFELDPRWQTVKCGLCGERVESFAALLSFARWYDKLVAMQREATWDQIASLRGQLRAIRDRVALNDADREEIRHAVNTTGKDTTIANLRALLDRLYVKVDAARSERRAKRRGRA